MSKALTTPYVCFANALIANAPQSYKKSVRIYTFRTISCEITEILIHLCHDKGKITAFLGIIPLVISQETLLLLVK